MFNEKRVGYEAYIVAGQESSGKALVKKNMVMVARVGVNLGPSR